MLQLMVPTSPFPRSYGHPLQPHPNPIWLCIPVLFCAVALVATLNIHNSVLEGSELNPADLVCTISWGYGGGSGCGLPRQKSIRVVEKKGCGIRDKDECMGVLDDGLLPADVPPFDVGVAVFLHTFGGSGSGAWHCGSLLRPTAGDGPIGDPVMFHRPPLTGAGRGSPLGWSMSHCLAVVAARAVLALLPLSAICSCVQNIFLGRFIRCSRKSHSGKGSRVLAQMCLCLAVGLVCHHCATSERKGSGQEPMNSCCR